QWLEAAKLYLGSLATNRYMPTENDPLYYKEDRQDNRKPEINIVRGKCNAALSQTIAYQFASGDKNWDINPTAIPDIDDYDVGATQKLAGQPMQPKEALAYRASLMSAEIDYHLTCSRHAQETRLAMKDWGILGTGIMKGPTNSSKYKKTYVKTTTPEGKVIRVPTFMQESVPHVY